jgi:hypothetical protein
MQHDTLEVPAADAPFQQVIAFAQTFDGYATWGGIGPAQQRHDAARGAFDEDGALPTDLDDLRAALFLAQREHHWAHTGGFIDVAPEDADADFEVVTPPASFEEPLEAYMRALVDAIREAA